MVKQTQLANTNTGAFLFSNTKSCMNGGGYGVTNESLRQASENGLGRAANAIVKYSSCPQTGGNMADVYNNSMTNSYGYLKGDVESNIYLGVVMHQLENTQLIRVVKAVARKDVEKEEKAEKAEDVEEKQINEERDIAEIKREKEERVEKNDKYL